MKGLVLILNIVLLNSNLFRIVVAQEPTPMEGKVVGGANALIINHPHVAGLWVQCAIEDGLFTIVHSACGSTIINQYFLLTAAHCIAQCKASSSIGISVGTTKIYKVSHLASSFEKHIDYDHMSQSNDIAIIKTNVPLKFSHNVKRAIYSKSLEVPYKQKGWIAGWGVFDETKNLSIHDLMETRQYVFEEEVCEQMYPDRPSNTFCAGGVCDSPCANLHGFGSFGDGGSGLTVNQAVIGIMTHRRVSNIGANDTDTSNIYTEVRPYYDWIKDNMATLLCLK